MRTPSPSRAVVPLAACLLLLGACSDPAPVADDPEPTRATDSPAPTPEEPSPTESSSPSPTEEPAARTVAAYYVGDTERAGPRLYREFQGGEGEALPAAVTALTAGPDDPDYRTAWSGGQLRSASYDGEVVTVVVDPAVRSRPGDMSQAEARAAVQQVVYTVQAAVQERAPVQFATDANPIDQVFGVPTSEPLANDPALDVLSHMSITSPEQGETVSGDTLRATGVGNGFEASVGWRILRGDEVVDEGAGIMEGWMEPRLFPWEVEVDVSGLEPGQYTFWVTTDDPTGGTEGIGAMTDDREFTVE
jgi:hypothetical protein